MLKYLLLGIILISILVIVLIIYLIRFEKYQASIGALRPSYPGEYKEIGGVPRGLGWV